MSLKTGRASGVSADNAHGVIRPGYQRMQASPGPPESLAGQATAPRVPARRLRLHVAEHRCRRSRRGIAQGAQFVEADAGEDFHRAADRRGAGLCSSSLARPARALAPTVEALPLMVCRVAALPWTSPSPSWRSSWAKRSCMSERSAATDDQLRGCRRKRPTISPRASTQFRPRPLPLPARPSAAPAEMTEQAKHPSAPCRSASPHGRSCRRQAASRSASEALAVMAGIGSPAKRPSARILQVASRPSISGICMSISTASNSTLASSTC